MTYKQADDYGDMHDITKLWKGKKSCIIFCNTIILILYL